MADTGITIGERLEEARKRKGISVREAAEATKVRGDYLLAMENNSFEIPLPEIYVRGFLKIYTNYLRLDLDKIMAEFDATRAITRKGLHHSSSARRDPAAAGSPSVSASGSQGRLTFGRMELSQSDAGEHAPSGPSPVPPDGVSARGDSSQWMRPALILGSVVVAVVVIALIIFSFVGSGDDSDQRASARLAQTEVRPVTLIASDMVTVWVIRKSDNSRVYEGNMSAGQIQRVNVSGPVEIRYSNGRALQVERDGKRMRIGVEGTGRSILD
jgi:transcriptional regulator with XRE-family HTH domain